MPDQSKIICVGRERRGCRDAPADRAIVDDRAQIVIASLIETCKMNGVEPYAWLKSTLEKIAGGHPQSRVRELLPWNFDPASS